MKLLKFYACTANDPNRLFKFKVSGKRECPAAIKRFEKKFGKVKAAWYQETSNRVLIENTRVF